MPIFLRRAGALVWVNKVPLMWMEPLVGVSRKLMQRRTVDLPLPDGPIRETVWPWGMERERESMTVSSPNCLWRFRISIMIA